MGRSEERDAEALFEAIDGEYLVGLGNWLARSLDPLELENEQVLLLQVVLERCMNALWQAFPEVLAPYIMRMVALSGSKNEQDDE